ncbi:MAG: hypothetical protein ACUVQH_10330 [Thermogutta sp.]
MTRRESAILALFLTIACTAGLAGGLAIAEQSSSEQQPSASPVKATPYRPTSEYTSRKTRGWSLMIAPDLLADEGLAEKVFAELDRQLAAIEQAVPPGPLEKIRTITIWVEKEEGHHPCMAYHPDRGWLINHDMNPDKAKCVEIANAHNFIRWTKDQPWMVLHELAHGYHHQFLPEGYRNKQLAAAFERAKANGKYESVAHVRGGKTRAYALNNPMEFFAENTEALFGKNDFFPFDRADFKDFDQVSFSLLCKLWELPDENVSVESDAVSQ